MGLLLKLFYIARVVNHMRNFVNVWKVLTMRGKFLLIHMLARRIINFVFGVSLIVLILIIFIQLCSFTNEMFTFLNMSRSKFVYIINFRFVEEIYILFYTSILMWHIKQSLIVNITQKFNFWIIALKRH